jgi:hypothetical protein
MAALAELTFILFCGGPKNRPQPAPMAPAIVVSER